MASLSAAANARRGATVLSAADDLRAGILRDDAAAFELSAEVRNRLQDGTTLLITGLPIDTRHTVDLELERFTIFGPSTQIIVQDGGGPFQVPVPEVALYRGTVRGDPASRVFLGVGPDQASGFISYAGTSYSISSGPAQRLAASVGLQCFVSELGAGRSVSNDAMECGTRWQDLPDISSWSAGGQSTDPSPAVRVCYMAVVCDYDLYNRMGGNVDATAGYIAQLFGAASVLFEHDFGITLTLNLIEVWTTPQDPFTRCGINGLEEFRDYGNKHLLDVHWNLAYKASGCGGGGRAFADGICLGQGPRGNNPYATAAITGFFPTPVGPNAENYDLYLVAHETTHNFGVGHTHCYDPPLDSCRNDESSCYKGEVFCTRGTIMSYCFQCGGMGNIDLRFHPHIIDIVKSRLALSCLETSAPGFYTENTGNATLYIDSVVSTADWLRASRDAFLISANDTTTLFAIVDWSKVREHSVTASLMVYAANDPLASPLAVDVTAIRHRPFADYAPSVTAGCWPLTVEFNDLSGNNPMEWVWSFGDLDSSTESSPVHTYTRAGTYTVTMMTRNECGIDRATETRIHVTEPDLCCTLSTFVIPKNLVLQEAIDLWDCGLPSPDKNDDVRFVIAGDPPPGVGAGIARNRYLNFFPASGWYGTSDFAVQAITSDNCRCETPVRVIINDPPQITLLDPPFGVQVVNRPYQFRWRHSDGNDNARIDLYYTDASDCSGGILINSDRPIQEDHSPDAGSYIWQVYGVPDGYYRLRAVIRDPYTQSESCSPGTILLDLTPPTTTATVTCLGVYADEWCHGDIEVALNAVDTLTGIDGMFYSLNRGPWQRYTQPLTITAVGQTLVEYFSVDSAGNVEQPRTTTTPVQIDRLAPYIQQFDSGNKLFRSGDYTVNTPEFSIVLGDEGVGVNPQTIVVDFTPGTADGPLHYTYDDDNVSYNEERRRVTVQATEPLLPGAQRVTLTVADVLGNEGTASADFVVESGMAIRDVVNSPNPFQQETYFTFTLTEEPTEVRIRIFDLSGTLMREIVARDAHAGYNEVFWNGQTDDGLTLANGAYLYEITATGPGGTDRHLDKCAILR
ncbi:MAG: hypothetical protein Kow0074_01950 [Candidatus Zixiibacteriota bacterium]